MRVSHSFWTASVVASGVAASLAEAIPKPNAVFAARDDTPPRQTVTIPGYTITKTGETLTTVTSNGESVGMTTVELPASTTTLPAQTIVAEPLSKVTLCPQPTGSPAQARIGHSFDFRYGCPSGRICIPTMPKGCNMWPGPPEPNFVCKDEDCQPPPSVDLDSLERRPDYYELAWGYFPLNPEPFGLGWNIYAYATNIVVAALSMRQLTDPTLSECFVTCADANTLFNGDADPDVLCVPGNSFFDNMKACAGCIMGYKNTDKEGTKVFLPDKLDEALDFCTNLDPVPTTPPGVSPSPSGSPTTSAQGTPSPSTTGTPTPTEPTSTSPTSTSPTSTSPTSTSPTSTSPTSTSPTSTSPTSTSPTSTSPTSTSPTSTSPTTTEPPTTSTPTTSEETSSPTTSDESTSSGTSEEPSSSVPGASTDIAPPATDGTGSATTFGGPDTVPTTQNTIIIPSQPTQTPGGAPTPIPPPQSTGFHFTVGATILATLLTFLAVIA